jgi:cell wall-associated NlpC family hydrolase
MFVSNRAKARIVALVMAASVLFQMWPNAYADEVAKATIAAKEAETKAPKKDKKRRTGHGDISKHSTSPWRPAPVASHLSRARAADAPRAERPERKDVDPVKLVLATARKQLGKPYRWAGVGPNAFDCSGFTAYVWKRAGISLPHNSGAQRAATKPVSLDKMKPGDLIFSSGHVGMYIGGGKMIHSPHSGRVVSIDPIHSNAYGAGRPLP